MILDEHADPELLDQEAWAYQTMTNALKSMSSEQTLSRHSGEFGKDKMGDILDTGCILINGVKS